MEFPDAYRWVAEYEDGEQLWEEHGIGFSHIDQDRLVRFHLVPQRPGLPHSILVMQNHMRLIFFRDRTVVVSGEPVPEGEEPQIKSRTAITCVGWQKTVGGKNVHHLNFYFEDGSIVSCDDKKALQT